MLLVDKGHVTSDAGLLSQNESAPETGALQNFTVRASGRDLGWLDLQTFAGASDWDCPWLHRLRNLALEVNV